MVDEQRFRVGINYWPARTAMAWWQSYDRAEVDEDFARIAAAGFDSVRIFLTWESFQPHPDRLDPVSLERLVATLDAAQQAGLAVMPTLFTGHMSGANFIPDWALTQPADKARFRTVSRGQVTRAAPANWYANLAVAHAQARMARGLGGALAGHPALWAWDLGNESSNCVTPPSRDHARSWLARVSDALREGDHRALVTIGLHMEDLENDRNLGPCEAAEFCDFLTMHGYPIYAPWARGPLDHELLPFLADMTRWLAQGTTILFSEFGTATYRRGDSEGQRGATTEILVEEQDAAVYVGRALSALHESGCAGAMLWCHSDYARAAWQMPPLDEAVHERSFGLWRADQSPKPALDAIEAFAKRELGTRAPRAPEWIDIPREEYYWAPEVNLPRLYARYVARAGS